MHSSSFPTNQLKETDMKHQRSSKKECYGQVEVVSYIFLLYGINLNCFKNSQTRSGLLWFIRKFIVLFHIYTCAVFAFSLYQTQYQKVEFETFKRLAARNFIFLTAIILWHIINRRGKELCNLFEFMKKQKIDFQIANNIYIFSVLWPILTLIITFKHSSSSISYIRTYFFHFYDSSTCNCYFLYYVIVFIHATLNKTFVSCVVILYSSTCNHFQKVILKYVESNTQLASFRNNSNETVELRFCIYESIIKNIKRFESIMAFPIFVAFMFNVAEAFYGMLVLLNKSNDEINWKSCDYIIRGFISICLIIYAASDVNEEDKKAKVSNNDLLRSAFVVSNLENLDTKLNLRHENEKPSLTLTAWGFFEFKRSFVFAAVGCVLTYALLFINLKM